MEEGDNGFKYRELYEEAKKIRGMKISKKWASPPEELEITGEVLFYNYCCRSCGHKGKFNEATVFLGISDEPEVWDCPQLWWGF